MSIAIHSLDHLVINVTDLETSAVWYQRVLGVVPEKPSDDPTNVDRSKAATNRSRNTFRFGQQALRLRPVSTSKEDWATADHESAGSDDLCFLTRSSPEAVVQHLRECGVAVEIGPVPRRGARGRLNSVYVRDPDGSIIEIASYDDATQDRV